MQTFLYSLGNFVNKGFPTLNAEWYISVIKLIYFDI